MHDVLQKKVEDFFQQFNHQFYNSGEVIIRAEESPSGVFYLKRGSVKVYTISHKGDELVTNIFKPSTFFPMSWAVNTTQNLYFYEARTDVEVWLAPKEKIINFIISNPDVLYDLLRRVYKGTDGLLTRMTYLMAGNAYARLTTEIILQAKRFGIQEGNIIKISISEKELASQTGMTRETVSREMRVLKEKKLLTFNNKVIAVNDFKRLEEETIEGV